MSAQSSTQFYTIAVAGATGNTVGPYITKSLLDANKKVKVLTRANSAGLEKLPKHANLEIVNVDYASVESLSKALQGVDAVISTVGGAGIVESQLNLIKASKAAGVKRFYPSEFGGDIGAFKNELNDYALFNLKQIVRNAVEESGLEYTYVITGFFYTFTGLVGIDAQGAKANIVGDGNTRLSFSDYADIGKFVVESLDLPQSKNATIYIDSEVLTYNQLVQRFEQKHGKKFQVSYTTIEEAKKKNDKTFATFGLQLQILAAEGKVLNARSHNGLFSFKPTTFEQFLAKN